MKLLVDKWMNSATFAPDGDSGAAAPAATPAATPSSSEMGGADLSSSDLESFGSPDDFDSVDVGDTSDVSPTPTPTPTPAPAVEPPTPAPAPVAAPVKEVTPPMVAPAPTPKADASPPSEIDTLSASFANKENEAALQAWLAENSFKLTKEEAEAFETDALGMLPKIAAKVQVASMKAALHMMKTLLPSMIDSRVSTTSASKAKAEEAIGEFYATNTDLNKEAHAPLVQKWAAAFRAQNPSASRQDAIKFVGQAIRTELGLPPLAPGAGPKAKPQAFAPARPGARQPVAAVVDENPFSALGMDIEE